MTLEAECALSFYQEATALDPQKNIYLVRHAESGNLYVKKELHVFDIRVYRALFEMRIPGTPEIIELIEDGDVLYVIEEYIHGDNLQKLYEQRGCFSEQEISDFSKKLTDILVSLQEHSPAIVHRDIKPSNLILTKDGVLKLIDFNSAKIIRTEEQTQAQENKSENLDTGTRDTVLLGTVNFAAPEQYGFRASDERTDVFGFAATMNYLLTGKYPSEGVTSGKFGPIFKKCLAMDPDDRYQNAKQLKDGLVEKEMAWRWFLPVGFRSGNKLAMVLCGIYYAVVLMYVLIPEEGITIVDNIISLIFLLLPIGVLGNYGNFHRFITPHIPNKIVRYIVLFIITVLLDGIVLLFTP